MKLESRLAGVLEDFIAEESRRGNITTVRTQEAKPAAFGDWPAGLDRRIVDAFRERGIDRLYRHQSEAVESALAGRDTVIVTPTASGKT